MGVRSFALLLTVAALFASSFLFIRIAAPAFGPLLLIDVRVLLAAAFLLLYALARRRPLRLNRSWRAWLLLGLLNSGLPFTLIAAAELVVTASLASMFMAAIPIFTAVVAALTLGQAFGPRKIVGLLTGILGVIILTGWSPLELTPLTLLAMLALLVSTISYAIGNVYVAVRFAGVPPLSVTIGSLLAAGAMLLPPSLLTLPATPPPANALLAVLALALFGTALAFAGFFQLIATIGPVSTALVAYLIPLFGTLWGALFLREPLSVGMFVALGVILGSVLLVTGVPKGRGGVSGASVEGSSGG